MELSYTILRDIQEIGYTANTTRSGGIVLLPIARELNPKAVRGHETKIFPNLARLQAWLYEQPKAMPELPVDEVEPDLFKLALERAAARKAGRL